MVKQPQIIDMLTAGMRGASARQTVLAENIANSQTPGYRRRVLEFENALANAMESGDGISGPLETRVSMPDSTPADDTGNNVDLETEIGSLIQNSSNYKTYVRVLNKVYRQMELAMAIQ